MGNLKDELLKKGLADEKRARQLAHDEKARRNKIGRDAVEDERRQREAERLARESSRREADRVRGVELRREEEARAVRLALVQMVRDHALTQGVRGPRRWHFVARDRKIPYLDLSDEVGKKLESGALAICEVPDTSPEQFVVVPADVAARLQEAAPDCVLFHNRG